MSPDPDGGHTRPPGPPAEHRAAAADPEDPDPEAADPEARDPAVAPRAALARARQVARERGFRPGMKPTRRRRLPSDTVRSGPDRDARDPAPIGEQLGRLLAERGWHPDVAVGSVTGRWAQIVGPDVAAHVQPVSFDAGVLTVQAESTAWATQMRLLASSLLGRLAEEVGAGTVTELVVLGPAAPRWGRGARRVAGRGPRDTFG
ncbi:MAG: DUF721 domain-containing protein [Dermatophilaceae bacterium]